MFLNNIICGISTTDRNNNNKIQNLQWAQPLVKKTGMVLPRGAWRVPGQQAWVGPEVEQLMGEVAIASHHLPELWNHAQLHPSYQCQNVLFLPLTEGTWSDCWHKGYWLVWVVDLVNLCNQWSRRTKRNHLAGFKFNTVHHYCTL